MGWASSSGHLCGSRYDHAVRSPESESVSTAAALMTTAITRKGTGQGDRCGVPFGEQVAAADLAGLGRRAPRPTAFPSRRGFCEARRRRGPRGRGRFTVVLEWPLDRPRLPAGRSSRAIPAVTEGTPRTATRACPGPGSVLSCPPHGGIRPRACTVPCGRARHGRTRPSSTEPRSRARRSRAVGPGWPPPRRSRVPCRPAAPRHQDAHAAVGFLPCGTPVFPPGFGYPISPWRRRRARPGRARPLPARVRCGRGVGARPRAMPPPALRNGRCATRSASACWCP